MRFYAAGLALLSALLATACGPGLRYVRPPSDPTLSSASSPAPAGTEDAKSEESAAELTPEETLEVKPSAVTPLPLSARIPKIRSLLVQDHHRIVGDQVRATGYRFHGEQLSGAWIQPQASIRPALRLPVSPPPMGVTPCGVRLR